MNNNQKITPEVYEDAKIMLKYGMTQKEVAEKIGCSENTVWIINKTVNHEEYQKYQNTRTMNQKNPKTKEQQKPGEIVEHKYNVTIQATHYMEEQQKRTNELLTLISNKLAFIVEKLDGSKK